MDPYCIVAFRKDVVQKGVHAGDVAKKISALVGGRGGGKDHMAQFGVPSEEKIQFAFEEFLKYTAEKLGTGTLA